MRGYFLSFFVLLIMIPFFPCVAFVQLWTSRGLRLEQQLERSSGRIYDDIVTPLSYLLVQGAFPEEQPFGLEGFLSFEGDEIILYFSKYDYQYGNRENAILIEPETFNANLENEIKNNPGFLWRLREEIHGKQTVIFQYGGLSVFSLTKEEGQGCLAQTGSKYHIMASNLYEFSDTQRWEPRQVEIPVRFDDGKWKKDFAYGAGTSLNEALSLSLYRYMWNPAPYQGKFVEICGKLYAYAEIHMTSMSNSLTATSYLCVPIFRKNRFHSLEGSLIKGYDYYYEVLSGGMAIPAPILDSSYRNVGVLMRGMISRIEAYPSLWENDEFEVSECYMKLQPKRGETEE